MRVIILILGFLTLSSCSPTKRIEGTYTSFVPNKITRLLFYRNISFSKGTELNINKDSTYTLITCGNIVTGNWHIATDSLRLFAKTNNWKIDSLRENSPPPRLGFGYESYLIKNNKLKKSGNLFLNDTTKIKAINMLIKE